MPTKQTVMIIDDDPINNFLSKLAIRNALPQFAVVEFQNAMDALKALSKNKNNASELPWLILLDINMPVMEGWVFLQKYGRIKKELITQPIIFVLSASDHDEDIAKARNTELVSNYIIKPLTVTKLKELIHITTPT